MHRHTPTLRQSRMNLNYIYYRVEQLEMIVHRMAHTHTQTVARLHNCCRTWITMASQKFWPRSRCSDRLTMMYYVEHVRHELFTIVPLRSQQQSKWKSPPILFHRNIHSAQTQKWQRCMNSPCFKRNKFQYVFFFSRLSNFRLRKYSTTHNVRTCGHTGLCPARHSADAGLSFQHGWSLGTRCPRRILQVNTIGTVMMHKQNETKTMKNTK